MGNIILASHKKTGTKAVHVLRGYAYLGRGCLYFIGRKLAQSNTAYL